MCQNSFYQTPTSQSKGLFSFTTSKRRKFWVMPSLEKEPLMHDKHTPGREYKYSVWFTKIFPRLLTFSWTFLNYDTCRVPSFRSFTGFLSGGQEVLMQNTWQNFKNAHSISVQKSAIIDFYFGNMSKRNPVPSKLTFAVTDKGSSQSGRAILK